MSERDPDVFRNLRVELREWIESRLSTLVDTTGLELPVVDDFCLSVAASSATDGPGEGKTCMGYVSSANAAYRTHGLLQAISKAFEQPIEGGVP